MSGHERLLQDVAGGVSSGRAVSWGLLLDTLAGGAMMHALTTPSDLKASLNREVRSHTERLVSILIRSVGGQA